MKLKFTALTMIFFATLQIACKKQNAIVDKALYGKWKLTEMYDEYGAAGTYLWNDVSNENAHYLEFTANSHYKKTESSGGAFRQCSGTYKFLTHTKIEVDSNCEPKIERLTISELTNETLIIDHLGTEGVIRYKYKVDR